MIGAIDTSNPKSLSPDVDPGPTMPTTEMRWQPGGFAPALLPVLTVPPPILLSELDNRFVRGKGRERKEKGGDGG